MTVAPTRRRAARPLARARLSTPIRRLPRLPALLVGGWALLLVAWAVGNPPFMAPDEPAHYLRAVSVGEGRLGAEHFVEVPPRLWTDWRHPEGATCNAGKPRVSAACVVDTRPIDAPLAVATGAGAYPPLYYVLPGAVLRVVDGPFDATRASRLAAALVALAFLALAAVLLVDRDSPRMSLLGLVVTVSPMVVFLGASLNSSGLEVAAGIAFFAALLRLARGEPEPWVWAGAAAAGLALALSRATGALWLMLDVLLVAALLGPRGILRTARFAPRSAAVVGVLLLGAALVNRVWEQVYGNAITQEGPVGSSAAAEPDAPPGGVRFWLWHGVQQLDRILNEYVGVFGWLDTLMPMPSYAFWQGMVAAVLGLAIVAGTRRERWLLVAAICLSLGVAVLISASLVSATGMDVQGRHVLPFAVAVPLLAGEVLYRNRARLALLDTGVLFIVFGLLGAGLHVVAWYANAYRQSVGTEGPRFFLPQAEWSPPLGWMPWLLVTLAGAGLLAAAALPAAARRRSG